MRSKSKFLLGLIIAIAIFFRFYEINLMPGGLFPDEAANGLDVNLMQQGQLQPFYERGNGREALFFYMEWASVSLFGKGPWQLHLVSALVGVLEVLACYFVTRKVFLFNKNEDDPADKSRAENIALLATFFFSVSTWGIVLTRTAFRANLIPLFVSLVFYFLLSAYSARNGKKRLLMSVLAGASFAGGFYTYISFRIMVPALAVLLAWPLLASIKRHDFTNQLRKYSAPAFGFLLAFALVIFPLAKYFYQHPGSFIGRAGQVSVFNQTLYTYDGLELSGRPPLYVVLSVVAEVAKTQLTGYFAHGDLNWRQNISGWPMLSPLYSVFFGIGLAVATWLAILYFFAPNKKSGYWIYFLLAMWFWALLLPVITTAEGIPHGLRDSGDIPVVFILAAWILYEAVQLLKKAHQRLWQHRLFRQHDAEWIKNNHFTPPGMRLVNGAFRLLASAFFLALLAQAYYAYFVYAKSSPEYFYAFRSDLTPVSGYLVSTCRQSVASGNGPSKNTTFLVLDKYSLQTTDYLTSDPKGNFSDPCNVPYMQVEPEQAWELPQLQPGQRVVFTQSTIFDTKKFKEHHPEAHLLFEQRNQFQQTVLAVYGLWPKN